MDSGIFVASLDFELYWGMRDKVELEAYQENLLGAREAIPKMLTLFREYQIHATWAVVGMLYHRTKSDLLNWTPPILPHYAKEDLCNYRHLSAVGANEQDDPYHYAPSLIHRIASYPYQEIGTHTYSHYYCLEDGQDADTFRADLMMAQKAARRFGFEVVSIVFPRNQVNPDYLPICTELGIQTYRGNQISWMYQAGSELRNTLFKRCIRLLDAYLPLSGKNGYPLDVLKGMHNVPASRFLRPFSREMQWAEGIRKHRIKSEMTCAAKHGHLYHLWWHPHNFGRHIEENLSFLEDILQHFQCLHKEYGMRSMNMREAGEYIQNPNVVYPVHRKEG